MRDGAKLELSEVRGWHSRVLRSHKPGVLPCVVPLVCVGCRRCSRSQGCARKSEQATALFRLRCASRIASCSTTSRACSRTRTAVSPGKTVGGNGFSQTRLLLSTDLTTVSSVLSGGSVHVTTHTGVINKLNCLCSGRRGFCSSGQPHVHLKGFLPGVGCLTRAAGPYPSRLALTAARAMLQIPEARQVANLCRFCL